MNSKFILTLGVIILVLLGGFALFRNQGSKTENKGETSNIPVTVTERKGPQTTVTLTQNGFEPKEITIKPGERVIWVNNSKQPATVNSDPHPAHTLYPFLNLGEFADGSSVQVVFTEAGTYGYHNHLRPDEKGTVIVK